MGDDRDFGSLVTRVALIDDETLGDVDGARDAMRGDGAFGTATEGAALPAAPLGVTRDETRGTLDITTVFDAEDTGSRPAMAPFVVEVTVDEAVFAAVLVVALTVDAAAVREAPRTSAADSDDVSESFSGEGRSLSLSLFGCCCSRHCDVSSFWTLCCGEVVDIIVTCSGTYW